MDPMDALAEGPSGLPGLLDVLAASSQRAQSGREGGQTAPRKPQAAPDTYQTHEDGPKNSYDCWIIGSPVFRASETAQDAPNIVPN